MSNVRMLKAERRLSDEALATIGGFTGRQVVSARLSGSAKLDVEDVVRFAAALRVEPFVLMMSRAQALDWLERNPDFKPPRMRKQQRVRARKFHGTRNNEGRK